MGTGVVCISNPICVIMWSRVTAWRAERAVLFSSESLNEGHPDEIFDQGSDAVLDASPTWDPKCKAAKET